VRWEAMLPVLRGEIPVMVQADDIRQIQAALDWARDEGVRLIIAGGRDAPELSARLKDQGVPVILGGTLAMPLRDYEPYDMAYTVADRLYRAGVSFCISTGGDAANERNLPFHAAMAMSFGLPAEEALRAITLYPAQILGVGDRLGSIAPGKEATLILTDGDPLDIRTHVVREYIRGRLIDLSNKQSRLYEKYRERPGKTGDE
jgi:imidazolonepropionase-like amidohydrolase